MNQFGTIFGFEMKNFFRNKTFITVTLIFMIVITAVMFAPRVIALVTSGEESGEKQVMLVAGTDLREALAPAFEDYELRYCEESEIKPAIESGEAECGFVFEGLGKLTYYVNNLSIYDNNAGIAYSVVSELSRASALAAAGLDEAQIGAIMAPEIGMETVSLGVDQMQNYFYTYIMIIALYMVILLYGQMVASSVAGEKSSRCMELLITSTNPVSMMFGKVFAAGLAGLTQLVAIFGTATLMYNLNREYWGGFELADSFFDIPPELLAYMLVFFVLGFFVYAFLYGAVGSTVSKVEDISTACMPISYVFIAMYMLVIFSISSGDVDSPLMIAASFIPLTSPMAMFVRICMSSVPFWQIALSIALLVVGVIGIGALAAKIYRVGVLMYGNVPKPKELLQAIRKA